MATPADARAVKSLNTSGGRKKFVFKNLAQKVNEIDISGFFKSLEKVKPEPSEGSSFFRDCLVELRELNTAEDFISFYEEMLPFVQTLPLVIEQKEIIFTKLVSRLQMDARLSLDAILRLIAALSRDLLEDFIPFLPRIVNSLVALLENGGKKDADIIKQIFSSWCEILMNLQKYLVRDIEGILRDTLDLRYHPKDYINELMSESMSFLLRNARNEQLEKGINRILSEVADPAKQDGAVDLLYYAMRGTSGSLHSKAGRVLSAGTVVGVVSSTLERLCEDLEADKLNVMWKVQKGLKVHDYPSLIRLVGLIVSTFVASSETVVEGDNLSAVIDEVLQLMLCTINRVTDLETVASQWAPIFAVKRSSAINNMIWESSEEVIPLLLTFCENQLTSHDRVTIVDQTFEKIHEFLEENIKKVRQNIENTGLSQTDDAELASIWGVVNCYPYFKVDSSLLISFKDTLRQHLTVPDANSSSAPELMWQSLLGAALSSCHKLPRRINHNDIEEALSMAKDYKSCVQVLTPVADFLDSMHRLALGNDDRSKPQPELQEEKAKDAFGIFSENLRHPNKCIRLMTLRILCHFETFSSDSSSEEHPPKKKMKTEETKKPLHERNVLELLRSIEEIVPTVNTEGELITMIHEIKRNLSAGLCQLKSEKLDNHSENPNHNLSERPTDLIGRFNLFLCPPSNSTTTATVATQLLQTLQKVPKVAQSHASEILPRLLKFLGYNIENPTSVGLFNAQVCKGDDWRNVLKQWLTLLKLMKNPKSFQFSEFLNNVLQNRFLDDNDAELQTIVLECLLLWNDFLLPHREHLLKLIKPEELREELTTSNMSVDIEEAHKSLLFSLEIRILAPKVRTLKNLASRKPLNIISEETMDLFWSSGKASLDYFQKADFLKDFTGDTISTLSKNQKSGFLHVIQDILEVFDELRVRPFIDFLMGCVVRLMVNYEERNIASLTPRNDTAASSTPDNKENVSVHQDQAGTALKQFKELRSLCLKIIAHVLDKYEDSDLGSEFWDLFFSAVNPLIKNFKQEGSSSEKTSSLFSCFLSMSRNRNLVTLLCREESLIPDICSILTVTTASDAIKSSALKFIENLLCLDSELHEDDSMIKGFLDPYIETLFSSLHSLFIGDINKRKSIKYHGEREIRILKLLSKHMGDQSCAMKYLEVLLSFLDKNVKDSDIRREALLAIQDITSLLGTESVTKIINKVSPLLVDAEVDVRLCICDLLESLAKIDFSLDDVAKRIRDMNSISVMEVDDLDYERIVNAYVEIDSDFFAKSSKQHTMIILSQSLYNLSSESIMLRGSAHKLLSSFIEFSASILCQEASAHSGAGKEVKIADASWTGKHTLSIVDFILKHIADAVSKGGNIVKEWILLIREMVTKLPDAGNLGAFRPLCSEDENIDFFKSIIHIQSHRRAKAISRFAKVVGDSSLPENNVRNACTEALASVSAHMSWKSYYALLNRCFQDGGYRQEEIEGIHKSLQTVFGKMQKLMDSESDNVNVNSSVAALKVLKLLPKDVMDDYLSPIIKRIATFTKNRLESTRGEARSALVACLKELGLEYLQVVIKSLRDILKRGSELHVLGYTVHSILSKCLSKPTCGKLDHCLDDLLAVVETDIFGVVAEQKDVDKFKSKMKETGKSMSFETLKLISENVTFREHALKLLSPVTAQLRWHLTPKIKPDLVKMLQHIAVGIEGNPSVDQVDLFVFIYGCVDDGINNRNGLGDQGSSPPSKKKRKSRDETVGLISGAMSCPHLITVFALDLLQNRLKKIKLHNTDKELLGKLDSFIRLLTECLRSKYEEIVSSALRCFTSLIWFPLPSLMSGAEELKTSLLTIAQSAVDSSSSLVRSCLKLLTTLLGNKNITLSQEQLKLVIRFPMFADLESDPSFVAFSLLKAIVKRKLVVPEIYDVALQVSELLVKSQLDSIQKKCKEILLQFLVHYPLSEKRLQQHVEFLLQNLRYEHPTGREAVLDMLYALILKFSDRGKESVLDSQWRTMLIKLAPCLGTDTNKQVLSRIGSVITLLINCISEDQVGSVISVCLCWYKQQRVQAVAAQVLGFIIDAKRNQFQKHIHNTLEDAKVIMESALSASSLHNVEEGVIPFWKEAYHSLIMIEKMDVWKMVFKFLLHPHAWLRSKSCRLLNYYFKALARRKRAESQIVVSDSLLENPSSLFSVAVSLCSQLKELPTTGDDIEDLLIENIVFAVSSLHSLIGHSVQATDDGFWSSLGEDEQVVFLKAFEVLDSGKGRSTFLSLTSGKRTDNGEEEDAASGVRNVLIGSLLKRLGKVALDTESVQMKIVFNVYKAFTSQMNQEECRLYAYKILLPLYKVCEGFTGKIISDESKQLAEEVRDSIRDNTLGNQLFVEVYSEIRKSLRNKREKRKREEKTMAVVNPERNAKRKLRLASKNKANKRRRMTSMKLSRWARS
ncbi:hypothetical protein Bca4012_080701 [Brassica carinata]